MNLLADLRLALRRLSKQPGFTVTTIVTLALAIGANTAIFSVINAVLMHPSGVDAPQRVAIMRTHYSRLDLDFPVVSVPDYTDAASLTRQVESAAMGNVIGYNADHDGTVEHFDGAQVSWQWFNVFGAKPILGRTFSPEEDHPAANQVAVLSYNLWQSVFGGDRNVIGRSLMLNQTPYRIVGVMRSDFDWPRGTTVWTPLGLPPQAFTPENRFNENYHAVIRLRPQVKLAELNAGLSSRANADNLLDTRLGQFGQRAGWGMAAVPLTEFAAGPLRRPLYVLFGVVLLVLLIASANVAGLFLARTSTRIREFAIRTAMGASVGELSAAAAERNPAPRRRCHRYRNCAGTGIWQCSALDGSTQPGAGIYGQHLMGSTDLYRRGRITDCFDLRCWASGKNDPSATKFEFARRQDDDRITGKAAVT